MLHKVTATLNLTSGQLEVLKLIATIKGDTIPTYIKDCVLNELWGELDVYFQHGDIRRVEYYQKLGCKPVLPL